jgi:nucleotide-binding universal stress UspA family protein
LIVVETRQHKGRMVWMEECVAEPLASSSGEMTLILPQGSTGFVCPDDGRIALKNVVIPIASHPSPRPAVEAARRFMVHLPNAAGTATLLYVGDSCEMPAVPLPDVPGWAWEPVVRSGDVVDAILETASVRQADLIVMTTEGRHGFLDALRGSTTERVLRQARCPMLTMPVGSLLG